MTDALRAAAARLAATSDTPRLDAELLMAHALGITRERLLLDPRGNVPTDYAALIERRLMHEPIAYITGKRDFWTIELAVTPAVLIPRADSETLIEAAIAHFTGRAPARILDLGTGSGALLLAALSQWRNARGLGIDLSSAALAVARANATTLALADRAEFAERGWDAASDGGFDLVLCNPPYIAVGEVLPPDVADHEPAAALFAGEDGLADYRAIAPLLRLPAGGVACIEIGASQAKAVCGLFEAQGFDTRIRKDLAARDRCVIVTPR